MCERERIVGVIIERKKTEAQFHFMRFEGLWTFFLQLGRFR